MGEYSMIGIISMKIRSINRAKFFWYNRLGVKVYLSPRIAVSVIALEKFVAFQRHCYDEKDEYYCCLR